MSINWITFEISASEPVIVQFCLSLGEKLLHADISRSKTDAGNALLSVNSTQMTISEVDMIYEEIKRIAHENPEEIITVRYCASIPGSYHEIIGICRDGQMEITSDNAECILDE